MPLPLGLADVSGGSMAPSLRHGDVVLVRYGARVRPGDVVLARRPDRPSLVLLKRAVRRAGHGWWLEGDALAASTDSRHFGPVPDAAVLGRVLLRVRPPGPVRRQPAARRRAR